MPVTLTLSSSSPCCSTNLTTRKIKIIAGINELHLQLSSSCLKHCVQELQQAGAAAAAVLNIDVVIMA